MLEFVTKQQYWELLDAGLDRKLASAKFPWHLKSIQDTMAYYYLDNPQGLSIGEIGGGNSRLLPALASRNGLLQYRKVRRAARRTEEKNQTP